MFSSLSKVGRPRARFGDSPQISASSTRISNLNASKNGRGIMTASHERTGLPLGSDIAAMKKKEVWKEQRKDSEGGVRGGRDSDDSGMIQTRKSAGQRFRLERVRPCGAQSGA